MDNKKIIVVLIGLIILSIVCCVFYSKNDEPKNMYEATQLIKNEYEALNGTIRESDNATYGNVFIDDSIEIKILDVEDAIDFINEGTGILFIGAPWCPWCRNALPVLMEVARDNNLVIRYIDITDIRNIYEIENGKLVKTQKEGEGYKELLKCLDSVLGSDTYKLKDENGKVFDTGEKRIYIPMTVSLKNGSIEGTHVSTVSLNEGQTKYDSLDKNQKLELKSIYQDLISKTKGLDVCSSETMCD